jgi:serine O-acetyltransferase
MARAARGEFRELFVLDAARWIVPEEIGDPQTLRGRDIAVLLLRHPPLRAMAWLRFGGWLRSHRFRGGPSFVQRRLLRLYGLEIVPGADIGGGCYIAHPSGCTIRATRVGANATIVAAVTVGGAKERDASPVIGDNVFLGAGCRVIGSMTIGDDVKVGANAVVLHDVADGETVVGVPARPVRRAVGNP